MTHPYNPVTADWQRPMNPPPLARQALVVGVAAERWWSLFSSLDADDKSKFFDANIALAGAHRTLLLVEEFEADVRDAIRRARAAKAQDARPPPLPAPH